MAILHRGADCDITSSAGSAAAVTPNDSTDLSAVTRGLYVGVGGNIRVILDKDDASVNFIGVVAGSVLPLRIKRVLSSGTSASSLVALY